MPIPANGITTAKCDTDRMWLAAYGAQSHYVYFSTNETAVSMHMGDKRALIAELKTPANIVTPPKKLISGIAYYWRVDSENIDARYMGGV